MLLPIALTKIALCDLTRKVRAIFSSNESGKMLFVNGPIEVNKKIALFGQKFGNLESEILGRVRNWKLKTWVLKPKKNII